MQVLEDGRDKQTRFRNRNASRAEKNGGSAGRPNSRKGSCDRQVGGNAGVERGSQALKRL